MNATVSERPRAGRILWGCSLLAGLVVSGCNVASNPLPTLPNSPEFSLGPPPLDIRAVVGRTYNLSLPFRGNVGAVTCTVNPSLPAGFKLSGEATRCIISTSNLPVPGPPGSFTVTVTAHDLGTTKDAVLPLPPIQVKPPLSLTPPTGTLATAVTGRTYGQGMACGAMGTSLCTPINYTVQDGLGNYVSPGTMTTTAGTFACPFTSTGALSGTYACSSANITGSDSPMLSFTVSDTANATTPSGTATDGTKVLPINRMMALTPPMGTLPTAVTGRSYGQRMVCGPTGTSLCTPINYTVANGLGNYVSPGTMTSTAGTFTCPLTSTGPLSGTYACSSANITGSDSPMLSFTVSDTANAATPGGTATDSSKTLPINSRLALMRNFQTIPDAVTGRPYGAGITFTPVKGCFDGTPNVNCQNLIYTASGGLDLISRFDGMGFTTGISCMRLDPVGMPRKLDCSSPAVTAMSASAGTVTVMDTANNTTPAGTDQLTGQTVNVDPEFSAIATPFLQNGMQNEPYRQVLAAAPNNAGTGVNTWSVTTGGVDGVSFATSATVTSRNDDPRLGYYEGAFSSFSTSAGQFGITIGVADTGNATTPSCTAISPTPTCPTPKNFTVNVMQQLGYVATFASGTGELGNTVVEFRTESPFSVFRTISTNTDANRAANPVTPRVTPDGRFVYVTKQGDTRDVSAIDTILSTTGCTAPGTCPPVASGGLARNSIAVSNNGTFNPTGMAIGPQAFNTAAPFVRYNAWLVDPTVNNHAMASVEPILNAHNPAGVTSPLSPGNSLTLANANRIAISPDGRRAYMTHSDLPFGPGADLNPTFTVLDITTAPATVVTGGQIKVGMRTTAVAADPRGHLVYVARRETTGEVRVSVIRIPPTISAGTPVTQVRTIPGTVTNLCLSGSVNALGISPDATRLYALCVAANAVVVLDISNGDPTALTFGSTVTTIPLTTSLPNRCVTPVDVKANAAGTRLFVSCQDSDTVNVINITTNPPNPETYTVVAAIPTDNDPGNCGAPGGSCPQLLDMMVNPPLHLTTGGSSPTGPVGILPPGSAATGSYSRFVVATGGTLPRTWSETTRTSPTAMTPKLGSGASGTGACPFLSLNPATGEISGTLQPSSANTTCGPFRIRVTDVSTPGQFVERDFTITINP